METTATAGEVPMEAEERAEEKLGRVHRGGAAEERPLSRKNSEVILEGYVGGGGNGRLGRTTSLTSDDLEDLKGCVDLGFEFRYDDIPELRSTLPALELCYPRAQPAASSSRREDRNNDESPEASPLVADWKFITPGRLLLPLLLRLRSRVLGDNPEEVKARIKYWAEAVACIIKLCQD
ncbi:hypothetical protein ZIOFF_052764 [Zingiber officinale]|uniref:Uncharacterized protein n=1 Tax=Zingiber officinale TaxID=94328 RepID=A0A8J5FMN5_ZINOF|nr:hypothetical protein ZIOFF_052764 [Zingiber officinale]